MQTEQKTNNRWPLRFTEDGMPYLLVSELEGLLNEEQFAKLQGHLEKSIRFFSGDERAIVKGDFDRFIQVHNISR